MLQVQWNILISGGTGFCLTQNILKEWNWVHAPFQNACSVKLSYPCHINSQQIIDGNLVMFSFYVFQRSLIQAWVFTFTPSSAEAIINPDVIVLQNHMGLISAKQKCCKVFSNMQNFNFLHWSKWENKRTPQINKCKPGVYSNNPITKEESQTHVLNSSQIVTQI